MLEDYEYTEDQFSRLCEIRGRVDAFLDHYREAAAYDFENRSGARDAAQTALYDSIRLYALGGCEAEAVRALAVQYAHTCLREAPAPIVRGEPNPPPIPGTVGTKLQPQYARDMSKPPKADKALIGEVFTPEGETTQIDFNWRVCILLQDIEKQPVGYFFHKPVDAGAIVLASRARPAPAYDQEDISKSYHAKMYAPVTGLSYLIWHTEIPYTLDPYQIVDKSKGDALYKRGLVSGK
jgi:hypothetical protein